MGQPLAAALIGCGAVSEILYAGALTRLDRENLIHTAALVDPDPARTGSIGRIIPKAVQFRDLEAMLAAMTPDLAIIAAPHMFHAELAAACLERGIHVLCEKPMAASVSECEQMIQAAAKSHALLAVGHFRRFFPSCDIIKHILEVGFLGPVKSFRFLEGEVYSWPAQSASFFKRAEAGGGVLMDAGAHTLDLLLWWLGEVAEVECYDDAMGGVEANCQLFLKMASGVQGMVQLSRDWPLPNRYLIECEKGWVAYNCDVVDSVDWGLYSTDDGLEFQIKKALTTMARKVRALGKVPGLMGCFTNQLRNVAAAILGKEPLRVSWIQARQCVELMERCYQSRKPLDMPWLDPSERQRARELSHA